MVTEHEAGIVTLVPDGDGNVKDIMSTEMFFTQELCTMSACSIREDARS